MAAMRAGDHGSTFGGNPVSCAAALAGIDAMEAEGLPEHARVLGARAMERLLALERRHPKLRVRGLGLMIGIEVVGDDRHTPRPEAAAGIQRRALADGVLVICSGPEGNVIRVLPPLVITDPELSRALDVLEACADAELGAC
jgi:4-aminobutyrate aminotransferase/(S)-3-amino-2-methylpropionate transaminase